MKLGFDLRAFDADRLAGLMTWLLVASSALWLAIANSKVSQHDLVLAAFCHLCFIASWWFCTIKAPSSANRSPLLLFLQVACASGIFYLLPYNYSAILLVLTSALLPYFVSMGRAVLVIGLMHIPFYIIFHYHWHYQGVLLSTSLFMTFSIFALLMTHTHRKEKAAREASEQLNRELKATQALLKTAAQQAERVRIARELHDVMGHHLTALSLQLQVASHPACQDTAPHISAAYDLSNQLLNEVRQTVSELRQSSSSPLRQALIGLSDTVPEIDIIVDMSPQEMNLSTALNQDIKRIIQESITNAIRHGNAHCVKVTVAQDSDVIKLDISDDGSTSSTSHSFLVGNGLSGIQERVAQYQGQVSFEKTDRGFNTRISIPWN